jgi:UDP-3-O-[3-hydroxymyristoyl] N-acetylglucosamine deacetylase
MTERMQATIGRQFALSGPGLHTGRWSRVVVAPAPADHGLVCRVRDKASIGTVAATWVHRVPSAMSTTLGLAHGPRLRTVEHMLATFAAFGVDNAMIEVDGSEIPIFDGSAARWCAALTRAGIVAQNRPKRVIEIRAPIQIRLDGGFLRGEPCDGFQVDVTFDNLPGFGLMRWAGRIDRATFATEIAGARSFGRPPWAWLDRVFSASSHVRNGPGSNQPDPDLPNRAETCGYLVPPKPARSPDEPVLRGARPGRVAVAIGPWILGGRRFPDEPVRHVVLDLLGDLALAGGAIEGRIVAHVPSHEKTFAFVTALMQDATLQNSPAV